MWDVRWEGGGGRNEIAKEFGGRVVVERFDGRPGIDLQGMSVSVFDPEHDCWRQTWVDDQGGYFSLTGGVEGAAFVLRADAVRGGVPVGLRMTFSDIERDRFTWSWDRSTDDGVSWEQAWQIDYSRIT